MAVVCMPNANYQKKDFFFLIIEYISEVENKIRYTNQEETYVNRNVMFKKISEIIFQIVLTYILIIYVIYQFRSKEHYTLLI